MVTARKIFVIAIAMVALISAASIASATTPTFKDADHKAHNGVMKVHGFHCREEFGWNPLQGYYQQHRHKGICADLKRCRRKHKTCIRLLGRGWNKWEYMRWGDKTYKYYECMIKFDCY